MRDCMNRVVNLINAKTKCIWINTHEEEEVIKDMKTVSSLLKIPVPVYSFSFTCGVQKLNIADNKFVRPNPLMNIDRMLRQIYDITRDIKPSEEDLEEMKEEGVPVIENNNNIFILKDFHDLINNGHNIKRMIRDIIEEKYINYNTIVVVAPYYECPVELEKAFVVVDYDLPNKSYIKRVIEAAVRSSLKLGANPIDEEYKDKIVDACKGLTLNEIEHVIKLSLVNNRALLVEEFNGYKIELVKKSDMLEYRIPDSSIEEVGGNKAFKQWIDEVVASNSAEARAYGVPAPKGYLALGVPGTSKTMMAEALASKLGTNLIKWDMSKIMNSKVGQSEQNAASAIRMIKASAPCVLLIDEIEKTLSGMGSSNNSDSGTIARVIGSVLEFLNEDHGVFVVMTSNDITQLPPELTRTGRVDAIWYFGLPDLEERKEIFNIHFNKLNKEIGDDLITYASASTDRYTGAEIKEIVKSSIRKAYVRSLTDNNKDITRIDIQKAVKEIIPIAISSREKIAALENYAKNRARFSNKIIDDFGHSMKSNDALKQSLLTVKKK